MGTGRPDFGCARDEPSTCQGAKKETDVASSSVYPQGVGIAQVGSSGGRGYDTQETAIMFDSVGTAGLHSGSLKRNPVPISVAC